VYLGGLNDKQCKYSSLSHTYEAHNIETFLSLNLDCTQAAGNTQIQQSSKYAQA